ncbi:MAG: phosphotransferase family protein [Halanaeroarchaeum sp.]
MTDDDQPTYLERLVNEGALERYLERELGPADAFEYERLGAGHSNETLSLTWGDRDLVLRRPPAGDVAETAHDVLREFRVMDALQDTDVPVPPTVAACEDKDVIGAQFYLMERVDGEVLRDGEPPRFQPKEYRRKLGEIVVDTLAAIHTIDYESVGLSEFGHPAGFTRRQVERWQQQYEWAFEVTEAEREVPMVREIGDWLEKNAPDNTPHSLVHGDYKPDNLMVAPGTPPELASVFDWEMSTLGDPRTDLGWLFIYWYDERDPEPALGNFTDTFMTAEGYPSRRALRDRYERRTGIEFEHERFYRTLAVYKLGALGEMFYRRYLEGNSDDPLYPKMRERVPHLAHRGRRIIDGEEPL